MEQDNIIIKGAKVHNLKNIDLTLPRNSFIVITGLSGSGKSSLAFDTLYAEGQRRFAESLSSYARQFLGRMSKPDVDKIEGIPPAIAIEQRVNIRNPRSTVATTTEIYDYLRLIFARIGHTFSPISGKEVKLDTNESVVNDILTSGKQAAYILADINWNSREDRIEALLSYKEQGYTRLYDASCNKVYPIEDILQKEAVRAGEEAVEPAFTLLVDRVKLPVSANEDSDDADDDFKTRLWASVQDAFDRGNGHMLVAYLDSLHDSSVQVKEYSNLFEADGIVFRKCDEYLFSFNSPIGACPVCGGLGKTDGISEDLVIPDKSKSIFEGAIAPFKGEKMSWFKDLMCRNGFKYGLDVFKPYCRLSQKEIKLVWEGAKGETEEESIVGLNEFFKWVESQRYKIQYKYMLSRFSGRTTCRACSGSRLRPEALWVKIGGKNIAEVLGMTIEGAFDFFTNLELDSHDRKVAQKAIEEVLSRLQYLKEVGLQYLTLDRASNTLLGGESQRINLVTALGSCLVGSLYVLDEPSIGLHPRDTARLISVMKKLRDIGNTVVVVEHDEEIIRAADFIVDLGPGAGIHGGELVFFGKAGDNAAPGYDKSLTCAYIDHRITRYSRKKKDPADFIEIYGALEHNLKNIDVKIPLGCLCAITGVSGSGKSTLTGSILYPALCRYMEKAGPAPGTHRGIGGALNKINQVEYVDQNPIGKSTRSNAVTYLKIYDDIRKLMAEQQYAKISGYTAAHFSFNQEGGRCPECEGDGVIKIPMQFMSDVVMICDACAGKRFKADILEVRYRGKNIDDILNMSISEAICFFAEDKISRLAKNIAEKLKFIEDVGLGYIKLGQSSSTLSGGESQRIKLAWFLSMSADCRDKHILFIFDEPTTGLHFKDVETLLQCFDILIRKGHSVVVVEHNMDVMRAADWVIDLGPDAGDKGGEVVYAGKPEGIPQSSFTGRYLKAATI